MENNEFINNLFYVLNQPFVVAIGAALVIGFFALLIVHELSIGKKSVKEQNKKIDEEQKDNKKLRDSLNECKKSLLNEKDKYIESAKEEFYKFYQENETFRNLVINSLEKINNKGIKELLEGYNYGNKCEEATDN